MAISSYAGNSMQLCFENQANQYLKCCQWIVHEVGFEDPLRIGRWGKEQCVYRAGADRSSLAIFRRNVGIPEDDLSNRNR